MTERESGLPGASDGVRPGSSDGPDGARPGEPMPVGGRAALVPVRARVLPVLAVTALAALPLAFLGVFFLYPVLGMLDLGLRPDGAWDLGGVGEVLRRPRTGRIVTFTLVMAGAATLLSVALGVPVAFTLYRLRLPFARLLRSLVLVPFVLPTVVVGLMFNQLLGPGGPLEVLGWQGRWPAILAALVFFNVTVVVRTVGGTWEGLDRRAGQAAATLGASPLRVLATVTLPALAPSILSAASVVFLFCATAFGVVLTLGGLRYQTVETEIYLQTTELLDLRAAAVLSLVQLVVVAALLLVVARLRPRDAAGRRAAVADAARSPRPGDAPAIGLTVLTLAALALPVVELVRASLRAPDGGLTLESYRALGRAGVTGTDGLTVWDAFANSWRAAVDATWLSMVLAGLVAVIVTLRGRSRGERVALGLLDGAFMLPLGVSAVTVGYGFLVTLDRPPLDLRTSPILVPLAQALVALPLVVRTLAPALGAIDQRQRAAAATLGAGFWRRRLTVDLPLLWRPLLAATGFAFAVSLGEFGATSFLARPDRPTLPVLVYTLMGRQGADAYGAALAASVVLSAVTVAIMGAVERLHVKSLGSW